jgi:hypothetical protein
MGASAVGAAEYGCGATGCDSLNVSLFRAGGVGAAVGRSGVVVTAKGADVPFGLAGRSGMPILPALPTLREAVRGVGPFDVADLGEKINVVADPINVSRLDSHHYRGGSFSRPF